MQFSQSVTEVIKSRSSWRGYLVKSIEGEVKQRLDEFLAGNRVGLFGGEARFLLVAGTEADSNVLRGLGTYGFIKGARAFIVGAVKQSEKSLEDYGYLMEKIVLFATDLGLGTCWLGGSFNKSNFSRKISAAADELVPAVAAVGYVRRKRSKRDTLIRWSVGSKKRLGWDSLFFNGNFGTPLQGQLAGDYAVPLEMVRLGPSASNKQPWRVVKDNKKNVFHFYLERTKGYERNEKVLKSVDLQRVDMGIAMCHFEHSAAGMGFSGQWHCEAPVDIRLPERTEYIVSWCPHTG